MNAGVGHDLASAAAEDLLKERYVFNKKRDTSAAAHVHQGAFDYCGGAASYTFHIVWCAEIEPVETGSGMNGSKWAMPGGYLVPR